MINICRISAVLALSHALQPYRLVWVPSKLKRLVSRNVDLKMMQESDTLVYKYYKPVGVVSATLPEVEDNILLSGNLSAKSKVIFESSKYPIVPIGRLDKGFSNTNNMRYFTSEKSN
jgi:hypothetical protein